MNLAAWGRRSVFGTIGRQLRCPSGVLGRLVGHGLALVNREPNRLSIEALDVGHGDTVLEMGCGPGAALSALDSGTPAGRIIGVDLSPDMISLARRRNGRTVASGKIELYQASFTALPLEPETVDRILAVNVVYFFPAGPAALTEACRVLKPGGVMAVFATERASMQRFAFARPDTHRLFDADELVACLRQGFPAESIVIRKVSLAFGIAGLIATVHKSETQIRPDGPV